MKTFYRLDGSRASFREYAYDIPWLLMPILLPIIALIKLLRLQTSGSTDDPPVETLAPFEVEEAALPEVVRERFAPLEAELAALGFGQPIFHQIYCPLQSTYIYWATLLHATGEAVARIHHRIWSQKNIHKSYLFVVFTSETTDGSFLVTSAGKPDLLSPQAVELRFRTGAATSQLWQLHQMRLHEHRLVHLESQEQMRQMIERHQAALRDYHLGRGFFRPVSAAEQEKLASRSEEVPTTAAPASVEQEVLARLAQTGTQQPSWTNFLIILLISLAAFLGSGFVDQNLQGPAAGNRGLGGLDRRILWLLVPILLFHELGHYVTMRWFGYRNLRMFFIPFFGAAVAGKHFNIAGWKKAVVALAGPVPGILIGSGLFLMNLRWHQHTVFELATLLMILNAINLLPLMPLDGGWIVHAVIFCRHPLLDMAFRVIAIVCFFGVALLVGGFLFYMLAFGMLIGLPGAWQVAQAAHRLRGNKAIAVSPDDQSIPPEAARTILAELGAGRHNRMPANVLAQQVTSIFETLNARPPGVPASLALLAVQGISFVLPLACLVLHQVLLFHNMHRPQRPPAPPYHYSRGSTQTWQGPAAPAAAGPSSVTLIAAYPGKEMAQTRFAALQKELPRQSSLCLLGQSLVLILPENDEAASKHWKGRLGEGARQIVGGPRTSFLTLRFSCTLPSEAEARRLDEELHDYFHAANRNLLLAPWSTAWQALPKKDRLRFQKARRTLGRLQQLSVEAYAQPEVEAARKQLSNQPEMGKASRQETQRIMREARAAAEDRLLQKITAQDDKSIDSAVVDIWRRRLKLNKELPGLDRLATEAEREAWQRRLEGLHWEMAQHMGPLPQRGDQAPFVIDLEGATGNIDRPQGRSVSIFGVRFRQPVRGLPVFAEWLCQQASGEILYGFEANTIHLGGDDAIDEDADP